MAANRTPSTSDTTSNGDEQQARERALEKLRAAAEVFGSAGWGFAASDPRTNTFVLLNDAFASMHGYEPDELVGKAVASVFASTSMAELEKLIRGIHRRGYQRCESYHVRKDGSTFPVAVDGVAVRDAGGSVLYRAVSVQDITERKAAERAREESEERWRSVLGNAADYIALVDRAGTIKFLNRAAPGASVEQASCFSIYRYARPEDGEALRTRLAAVFATGQPQRLELAALAPYEHEDQPRWFDVRLGAVMDQDQVTAATIVATEITERKQAEEALRQSEERFRLLAEHAQDVVYRYQLYPERRAEYVSQAVTAILGYTPEEHYADPTLPARIVHPDDLALLEQALAGAVASPAVLRWIHRDGSVVWTEQRTFLVRDETGHAIAVTGIARDVTEQKRTEEALREREAQLAAQYKAIPVPTYTWKRAGEDFELIDFNDAAERATEGKALLGTRASEFFWDREDMVSDLETCYRDQRTVRRTVQLRRLATGEQGWFDITNAFVPPDLILVHAQNITDRLRAEEALRESEERFRLLAEHAQDIIFRYRIADPPACEYISPAVTRIAGYTPEEYYADPSFPASVIHPDDREAFERMVTDHVTEPVELRWICKDGSVIWTEQRNVPIVGDAGHLVALEGIIRDITEQKQAEEAVRESEERFRLLAEHAQDIIFRYYLKEPRHLEYVSPAFETLSGYDVGEFLADPELHRKIIHPDDRELLEQALREQSTNPPELRWIRKDGGVVWTEERDTLIYSDTGELIAVEGVIRDITERKRGEEALQRAREELEGTVERKLGRANLYGLTFREMTVLHLLAEGKADKEIARQLGISPLTVHKHVANILAKMRVASRTEATAHAIREGLLD